METNNPVPTKPRLETAVNIAILLVACLLAATLVQHLLHANRNESLATIKIGERLRVSSPVDKSRNKTLVLALSTNCHFCSESAPFYRKLLQQVADKHDVNTIALFPQSESEAAAYLRKMELSIVNIQQVDFRDVKVAGTPTLILMDQKKVVTNVWVGKLMSEQEDEVLSKF